MGVREEALRVIRRRIERGQPLYDFTGLASRARVEAAPDEVRTYLSEALILPEVKEACREHFEAPECDVVVGSRTTGLVIAAVLALEPERVLHVLPEGGEAHPCVERGCELVGAEYVEVEGLDEDPEEFDLVVVTGCDVSWRVIDEEVLERVGGAEVPSLLDDASGDRVRRLHGQRPGPAYGFDLVVTSCDKLMEGPRCGVLVGEPELVDRVRRVCEELGWTVDGPTLAAVRAAFERFDLERLRGRLEGIDVVVEGLSGVVGVERTGAGVVLEVEDPVRVGMELLRGYGIMTIPVLGYPGVSRELRLNLLTEDAERFGYERLVEVLRGVLG